LKPFILSGGIVGFVRRVGFLSRTWETSFAFRQVDGLINLPYRLLRPLYEKAEPAFKESILFKVLLLFIDRLHMLTAFFLFIALIVPHAYWYNVYSTIAVVVLLVLYFIRAVVNGRSGLCSGLIGVFLAIFAICVILAEVFSIIPGESLRFFAFYLTCFMLVLLLAASVRDRKDLMEVIVVIMAGLAVSGLYGVYQYVRGIPVNVSQIDVRVNEGNLSRVYSVLDNPNNFAEMIVLLLPFYLAAVMNTKNYYKKLLYLVLAVPPFASLLMTLSRSGWIGFAAAFLVFIFFAEKRLLPVIVLLGVLAFPFLPQTVYRRILTITNPADSSIATRFDEYKTVLPLLKDFWVTGLGLGNDVFTSALGNYYIFVKGGKILQHSHNLYLQIWIETGIAGILSFLAFLGATFKKCIRIIYNTRDRFVKNILIAGISSLSGILTIGAAEYVWFYPRVMLFFWAVVGIILAAFNILKKEAEADAEAVTTR